mmetsp:Transcript_24527/g.68751  ORF Transcript_24527/g.68751 Transcript_24527/m.68751 type:complete len:313 (-) Transcript_24527:795-1733(-)
MRPGASGHGDDFTSIIHIAGCIAPLLCIDQMDSELAQPQCIRYLTINEGSTRPRKTGATQVPSLRPRGPSDVIVVERSHLFHHLHDQRHHKLSQPVRRYRRRSDRKYRKPVTIKDLCVFQAHNVGKLDGVLSKFCVDRRSLRLVRRLNRRLDLLLCSLIHWREGRINRHHKIIRIQLKRQHPLRRNKQRKVRRHRHLGRHPQRKSLRHHRRFQRDGRRAAVRRVHKVHLRRLRFLQLNVEPARCRGEIKVLGAKGRVQNVVQQRVRQLHQHVPLLQQRDRIHHRRRRLERRHRVPVAVVDHVHLQLHRLPVR